MKRQLYQRVDGVEHGAGFLQAIPDGEAFRMAWSLQDDDGEACEYRGVGFQLRDKLFAARSKPGESGEPLAGVVVYDASVFGHLPARWYHADLAGRLGNGLSVNGPKAGLEGFYGAEYASATEKFDPLVKSVVRAGAGYLFRWHDGIRDIYTGIGYLEDGQLICGWAVPGVDVEVVAYEIREDESLQGRGLRMVRPDELRVETFAPKGPA